MRKKSTPKKLLVAAACTVCCLAAAGSAGAGEIETIMQSAYGAIELDEACPAKDLQVTVETRFVTVEDRFLEEVGVDFGLDPDRSTIGDTVTGEDGPVRNVKVEITAHAVRRVGNPPFQQLFEIGSQTVKSDRRGNYELDAARLITNEWVENIVVGAFQSFIFETRGLGRKKKLMKMSTRVELIVLPVVGDSF